MWATVWRLFAYGMQTVQTPRTPSMRWVQGYLGILAEAIVTLFSTRPMAYTSVSKFGKVVGLGCKAQPTK